MAMKTVAVGELKQRFCAYLRMVEAGQEVLVTSHRRPVARVVRAAETQERWRPPSRPIRDLLGVRGARPAGGARAVENLLEDRRRR